MRSIDLSIDRIVVDGLPAASARQFVAALEEQLGRMAREGRLPAGGGGTRRRIAALDGGALRPGASAAEAAAQVVETLRDALAGPAGRRPAAAPRPNREGGAKPHV